jgi:hypothetical protein
MTARKKTKPSYTESECNSVVFTIEAVYDINEPDIQEYIEHALENLRSVGSADVVNREAVVETFEEACRILEERAGA